MRKFVALSIILIGFFGMYSCTWNQKKVEVVEELQISPEREFFYEFCDADPSVWLEYQLPISDKEPDMIYSFDYKTRRTFKGLLESFTTTTRRDTEDPNLINLEKSVYHFLNKELLCLEGVKYELNTEEVFVVKERTLAFEKEVKGHDLENFWNSGNYEIWVDRVIRGIENGSAIVIPSQEEDDEYNSTFNSRILTALQKSEGVVQV